MPPSTTNKKKNKQKKKGSSSAAACDEVNLNTQVYEALTRLADTLAQLDERHNPPSESLSPGDDSIVKSSEGDASGNADSGEDEIVKLANDTTAMDLHPTTKSETEISPSTATDNDTLPVETATKDGQAEETTTVINPASSLPISHWRILPLEVESVYQLLNDGAEYIHATSTKYALVGKVDLKEGGNLAVELRKGAELIGTANLLLFSPSCGASRSLRHYVKQSSRALLASLLSLVKSFEDGSATEGVTFINTTIDHNTNNVAAQKTGAVWSACENIQRQLPKGNRAAMRRELMVWVRDCNESAEEFDEVMELGPRPEKIPEADEDCGDTFEEEEQYTEKEMAVAKASVNVMKCCKNVLGLALKACECVGENIDEALHKANQEKTDSNDEDTVPIQTKERKTEILQWISNLHELARAVGEGVTDFGISLYPPLDLSDAGYEQSENKAPNDNELAIPQLGSSHLEVRIQHQLRALADCVMHVHNARLAESGKSIQSCMSEEVQELAEKMKKAIIVRGNEVANAVSSYKCR